MEQPIRQSVAFFHVDAFTEKPFRGNPAAVCLLPAALPAAWMQSVAAEMNLSETAFVWAQGAGFQLRWFTPAVEVALCGHATLATAHVLWETELLEKTKPAHFDTLSGVLTAVREQDRIILDFPAKPAEPTPAPPGLLEALRLRESPQFVGRSQFDYSAPPK